MGNFTSNVEINHVKSAIGAAIAGHTLVGSPCMVHTREVAIKTVRYSRDTYLDHVETGR